MSSDKYRAAGDKNLAEILRQDRELGQIIDKFKERDRHETRRMLLGGAVRLTAAMAPDLILLVEGCRETLEVELPVELYVVPDPHFNAFCYGEERGRILIVLTSALIEALTPDELRFVIGHELGHQIFRHLDIPVGFIVRGDTGISKQQVLRLFSWQRYAEVSADRAGLVCAGALAPTASAFFKISSGLSGGRIELDIDEYLAQIGDIEAEALKSGSQVKREEVRADWFASHPFSPLRVRAAQLTADSELLREEGTPLAQLEEQIAKLMAIMDPGYLHDKSPTGEAMRRMLFSAGLMVAAAAGGITDAEIRRLEEFLGEGAVPEDPNIDAIVAQLPSRVEFVLDNVPPLKRGQLIRDLTLVALADGQVEEEELEEIERIAAMLLVDPTVIERSLEAALRGLD